MTVVLLGFAGPQSADACGVADTPKNIEIIPIEVIAVGTVTALHDTSLTIEVGEYWMGQEEATTLRVRSHIHGPHANEAPGDCAMLRQERLPLSIGSRIVAFAAQPEANQAEPFLLLDYIVVGPDTLGSIAQGMAAVSDDQPTIRTASRFDSNAGYAPSVPQSLVRADMLELYEHLRPYRPIAPTLAPVAPAAPLVPEPNYWLHGAVFLLALLVCASAILWEWRERKKF